MRHVVIMRRFLPTFLFVFFLVSPLEKAVAVPPDTCNEVIFYSEDHEGVAEWISIGGFPSSAGYALAWAFETNGVHSFSGTNYWFADNYGDPLRTEARLNSPEITIPSDVSNEIFLRFYHYFKTELGKDGGIIELSINSGPFVQVPGTYFTDNGYSGTLSGGTVLGIVEAFHGTSPNYPNYAASIVDLSTLVTIGDTIVIRFRMATDDSTTDDGWYVDDVQLGYCAASNTPPAADDLTISTLEDTPVTDSVTATDEDGDSLTFSLEAI